MTQPALHLRIVNMTSLPDGGPLEARVAPGGMLEAGRDSGLDWCLPDPQRLISSRHFELRTERGQWVIYDISTNGTYLNGATSRVKSPSPLNDGDRLQVGQYAIEIRFEQVAAPEHPAPPRPAARSLPGGIDPWAAAPSAPAPPAPEAPPQWPPAPASTPAPQGGDIWSMPGSAASSQDPAPEAPPAPSWPAPNAPAEPEVRQTTEPPIFPANEPGGGDSPFGQPGPAPQHDTGASASAAGLAPAPGGGAVLETIEAAAGLAPGTLSRGDPEAVAHEIGETLRALTEELSGLLQARAVARRSVRSAQVTMIGREDNNPLKFMPTPDQAMSIMFGTPRPGFQRGPAAVRAGFADIKSHQYATHAALQPALAQLLEDLTPEAIEKRLEGVRLNRKSRAWEMYVERWDAKARAHDNGLLDVFLALFAEAYDRESGRQG